MAELDVDIVYRPGRANSNADALSRSPLEDSTLSGEEPETQVATLHAEAQDQLLLESDEHSELSRSQMEDPYYLGLIQFHESGTLSSSQDLSKQITSEKDRFVVLEKLLYRVKTTKPSALGW